MSPLVGERDTTETGPGDTPSQDDQPEMTSTARPLIVPEGGVPPVIATPEELITAARALAEGTGPIAVDTERASGYRYSQRAYLIQIRRAGTGTQLIDPIPVGGDLGPMVEVLNNADWVLHAASQDLPCLTELGLRPRALFDTELAGRLAGFQRVALAALVEQVLGYRLEKGHGAADWSRRPLPADWLNYAALDVELLIELWAAMEAELTSQRKLGWALEEFEAVRTAPAPRPRTEPWRRTSGVHRARNPRQLAVVRELWEARDALARERDIAPGRVLPDNAIVDAAARDPEDLKALLALPIFGGRAQRRVAETWLAAVNRARALPREALPEMSPAHDGPPPPNRWADRDPAAAARLAAAREALAAIVGEWRLPVENLLQPDLLRRICWQPPTPVAEESVRQALLAGGARDWQIGLTLAALTEALLAG